MKPRDIYFLVTFALALVAIIIGVAGLVLTVALH